MLVRCALIVCALAACTLACAEITFYVSPAGNDAFSGKLFTPTDALQDGPFATLTRARDAIRDLRVDGVLPGPVTVRLRGGKYYLTETLTLDPALTESIDARSLLGQRVW